MLAGGRAHERLGLTGLPSVLSRIWLAWSFAERGDFPEAMAHAEDALAVAAAAGQPYSVAAAHLAHGQVHLLRGMLTQAIPAFERSAGLCRAWDLGVIAPTTAAALGLAYAWGGRIAEALPVLEEGEAQASTVRIFDTSTARIALGIGYVLAGRLDAAVVIASRVASLAAERGFRGAQAWVSHLLGAIGARHDPPEVPEAAGHYGRALALADELGMRPLVAHCHLGLGTLYAKLDQREQARVELSAAITLYRAMAMTFWLPETEAVLAQVEGR
jgi:tetratricopeptide (TPR) repeat protein